MQSFQEECNIFLSDSIDSAIREYEYIIAGKRCSSRFVGPFAHYTEKEEIIEFFSRIVLGILFETGCHCDVHLRFFNQKILEYTSPASDSYWGKILEPDQRVVEMVPSVMLLYFKRKLTWDTYTNEEKENLWQYFSQVNNGEIQKTNWLFFRIIVNEIFFKLYGKKDMDILSKCYRDVDELYLGDGWYVDGRFGNRVDYYNSFAFHYYGLLLSLIADNEYTYEYKRRAYLFGKEFIYWFSNDGSAIPYGRSLTYRLAMVAFWSACIGAKVYPCAMEVIKGIILRQLKWWNERAIKNEQDLFTVGFAYPNLIMSEFYNAYGSPYWMYKGFAFMLAQDADPFWDCSSVNLPALDKYHYCKSIEMVICRDDYHTCLFTNRHTRGQFIDNYKAKYMKFAYSSMFGFCVKRSDRMFDGGSYDSEMTISIQGQFFSRGALIESSCVGNFLYSKWQATPGVIVRSYVLAGVPWHIRIHVVNSEKSFRVNEAGFSVNNDGVKTMDSSIFIGAVNNGVASVVVPFTKDAHVSMGHGVNTNILYPRVSIPYCFWDFAAGMHIVVCGFYGGCLASFRENDMPSVIIEEKKIHITMDAREEVLDVPLKE